MLPELYSSDKSLTAQKYNLKRLSSNMIVQEALLN